MEHNDDSKSDGEGDNREGNVPGQSVLEEYLAMLQIELWEEERQLLEELIHCRVINKRIRDSNLVSARLTEVLAEIEQDKALVELQAARIDLQRRIQDFPTSNLDSMYSRQRELLELLRRGPRLVIPRPELHSSLGQSQIATSASTVDHPPPVGSISPYAAWANSAGHRTSDRTGLERGSLPTSHGLEDAATQNSQPIDTMNEASGSRAGGTPLSSEPSYDTSGASQGGGKDGSNPSAQRLRRSPRHKRSADELDQKPAAKK